jgi:hypothetical protein
MPYGGRFLPGADIVTGGGSLDCLEGGFQCWRRW